MIDELDLGFDEYERGRSRHRRGRGGKPKPRKPKRRGRSFVALFMALVLLAALGVAGWLGVSVVRKYFTVKDYPGAGTGQVDVQVQSGDSATDIANNLYAAHVVRSAKAFINAANANNNSRNIEAGYYRLRLQMKASLALDMLLARGKDGTLVNKVSTKVTIPEGTITLDVYALLSKASHIPVADFVAAAKDPIGLGVPDFWYHRGDGKPAQKPPSLEGFLFPATYEFDPHATAKDMLSTMVKKFLDVTTQMGFVDTVQKTLNISPYEALIGASIAQVEALAPDMAGVTRVLYNRVYTGKFPCSCLGLDSEVNYWLRISGQKPQASGALRNSQLHDPKDPYNTHDKAGMPIGPISNPGQEALQAAMVPAPKNNNVYFLAIDKAGHAAFAASLPQFCQLINKAIANGVSASRC
ncbi:MAG TPA: endolytic transglycosylase MltG [Rugosimonospora sp.]|nr:endolytic transglycosylase MltG [Rugosimonospora sp.]